VVGIITMLFIHRDKACIYACVSGKQKSWCARCASDMHLFKLFIWKGACVHNSDVSLLLFFAQARTYVVNMNLLIVARAHTHGVVCVCVLCLRRHRLWIAGVYCDCAEIRGELVTCSARALSYTANISCVMVYASNTAWYYACTVTVTCTF
jgi:hypothetical protein